MVTCVAIWKSPAYRELRTKKIREPIFITSGSSRPEMFCKKGVLRNFPKFTGKQLCQSLFFNKVAALRPLKKRPWHRRFPVNFPKFLRTPFLTEHLWLLLLNLILCLTCIISRVVKSFSSVQI